MSTENNLKPEKMNSDFLSPYMLEASVFTSPVHLNALQNMKYSGGFHISETLYNLIYTDHDNINKKLEILKYFTQEQAFDLPKEIFSIQNKLTTYKIDYKYVEPIYNYFRTSELPGDVKLILLEEYSFLAEHSSILAASKNFFEKIQKAGAIILDGSNKIYDKKHELFENIRGPRWIFGAGITAAGIASTPANPVLGAILAGSGVIIALIDP